jgi:hypothetical protein
LWVNASVAGSILVALISAFAASALTTWLALWRFRRERWWDKKFACYVSIIEALAIIALTNQTL